jgi:hypothetical protein
MIKSLKKNDIRTTPFTAAKKWNPQNKLHKDLILWQSGSVSGSLSLTFKEFNDGTVPPYTYISSAISLQQQEEDFLRFREGVNLSGSISPTGSFYYDPVLSEKNLDGTYKTVLYATTKHLFYKESQDPTKIFGLESLDSSNVNRSLPNKISTFNIPQNKFGEKVIPKSVAIKHEIQGQTYNVVDDGNSNLVINDKTFINNQDVNIDKVAANITLNISAGTYDYDSDPYEITATTKPTNLSYIVTYNGSTTPPTNAGTYTVVATINDNFYQGSVTDTFTIEQLSATITLSNLAQTYDGTPKSVTVSTTPSTLNRTVTYDGSTTPPTNVGAYTTLVAINDVNYKGLKSGRLVISGKSSTISAPNFSKTYGDADFTIPLNTNSNGSVSYTITSGPGTVNNGKIKITGVGTIGVTINQAASGNYAADSTTCSITVNTKSLTVTGITASDKVIDGNPNATLNTSKVNLIGLVTYSSGTKAKDDVILDVASATGTFSDSSSGEDKVVTISGLTISGTDSSKYTLIQPTTTAAIKANSASGTINISDTTVVYDGSPQRLSVSVNNTTIPIKITYKNQLGTILRVDRLYNSQLTEISGNYPIDASVYNVIAELDTSVPTATRYTVTTKTVKLNIVSIKGNITFGPNIFYYDEKPKPVATLSVTPPNKNLIITYNGSTTPPTNKGTYTVNVKFEDPNIFYNNTVTLSIIEIPTENCGTEIVNKPGYPQYQKNIIDLGSTVGTVNFLYSVGRGASQFTIEYPLNSNKFVFDSGLRSKDIAVGTDTVTGGGIPVNNTPISFNKDKTGINSDDGQNYDKCLVTVYSPTNDNTWNCSVSCVNAAPAVIQPLQGINDIFVPFVDVFVSYPVYANAGSGFNLNKLIGELEKEGDLGRLSLYEFDGILNILSNNYRSTFQFNKDYVLVDTVTNIKVIVTYKSDGKTATINLKYKRLGDSLESLIRTSSLVVDCHWFKYKGTKASFDVEDAKTQLIGQISSDKFKDTFLSPNSTITNGEKQRSLLKEFVNLAITNTSIDNVRFEFLSTSDEINIYTNPITIFKFNTLLDQDNSLLRDAEGILNDGLIYINPTDQVVEIVYPAICQPINFGSDQRQLGRN